MWTKRAAISLTLVIILVVLAIFAYLLIDGTFEALREETHEEDEKPEEKPYKTSNLWVSLTQSADPEDDDGSNDTPPKGRPLWHMSRPHRGAVPYAGENTIFSCVNPGEVALTFDDGPWHYTAHIMDLLERHNARGTFFVTGHNLYLQRRLDDESGPYPDLLRAMVRRGHQVGSHTWTHPHLDMLSSEERVRQMVWNEMALRNVLGVVPTYMRPPYGEWRDLGVRGDLDRLGYHVVMYDVDTKDYMHNSEDGIKDSIAVFDRAVADGGNGSYIVLCHDIREWTALRLVPAMLRILGERGYRAVTVGECLGDPERFWYRDPRARARIVEEIT